MKATNPVGVVVGRFQVARPHTGHRTLVNQVRRNHDTTLIVLGVAPTLPTLKNPLSYEVRKVMLEQEFQGIEVAPLRDHPSDEAWCEALDALVSSLYPERSAVLYGSRDSFLGTYRGRHETRFIPMADRKSGTAERARIKEHLSPLVPFRRGIIHTIANQQPHAYPAVDLAVVDHYQDRVLLGRKTTDAKDRYRFIGGFVDPTDASYEAAAKREGREELGQLELGELAYVGSCRVDDWRYRGTPDAIMTTLYCAQYIFGAPTAKDDIEAVAWFPRNRVMEVLVDTHRPLGEMLMAHLAKNHPVQRTT